MVSDFRREYAIDATRLRAMSAEEFHLLLQGLSEQSRFANAWAHAPKHVYDQGDIDAIRAAALR